MNYIILIIVGVAGIILGSYFGRRRRHPPATLSRSEGGQGKPENKRENLEKVRRIFDGQDKVANDDIEKLLGVSDVHPAN